MLNPTPTSQTPVSHEVREFGMPPEVSLEESGRLDYRLRELASRLEGENATYLDDLSVNVDTYEDYAVGHTLSGAQKRINDNRTNPSGLPISNIKKRIADRDEVNSVQRSAISEFMGREGNRLTAPHVEVIAAADEATNRLLLGALESLMVGINAAVEPVQAERTTDELYSDVAPGLEEMTRTVFRYEVHELVDGVEEVIDTPVQTVLGSLIRGSDTSGSTYKNKIDKERALSDALNKLNDRLNAVSHIADNTQGLEKYLREHNVVNPTALNDTVVDSLIESTKFEISETLYAKILTTLIDKFGSDRVSDDGGSIDDVAPIPEPKPNPLDDVMETPDPDIKYDTDTPEGRVEAAAAEIILANEGITLRRLRRLLTIRFHPDNTTDDTEMKIVQQNYFPTDINELQ